jgi:uncharacterized membrane protein
MAKQLRILLAGESWTSHTIHVKGFDSFTTSEYAEGGTQLIKGLESFGHKVTFIPNHAAPSDFPTTLKGLQAYDAVILSDIGSNTLLIHPDTFKKSVAMNNRCDLLAEYVRKGGGLMMVGGYLSFSGIDGKARYQRTALNAVLPIDMVEGDDRVEAPQGVIPTIIDKKHPVFAGISGSWPAFLGYNQLKAKANTEVLATVGEDVFIAVSRVGKGRSGVFASDCGPHWGPPPFVSWKHYARLWSNLVSYLGGDA